MKLFSMALKFNSLFAGNIACQSSLIAGDQIQSGFDSSTLGLDFMGLIFSKLGAFILHFLYLICTFVLNFIEVVQIAISKILGIGTDIKDYVVIDQSNPLVKILLDETVLTVFKTCCGLAIVFIILFTIISIIKSEYAFAVEKNETNGKGRILGRTLRSLFTLTIFPLMLIFVIVLTNAILAGFNDILRGEGSSNIAAQIYMTSAYNANNFRNYADDDERIPICINFDDPATNGTMSGYSKEELVKIYNSFQDTGRNIYNSVADRSFGSFTETISYQNNRIYNKSNYAGYEKFACTREQYYVMADFVDYAVKNGISYYVKNIKDVDIDWKYVDSTIFDKDSSSLTITYRDASNLTNNKSYTVVYTPSSEAISTPISDALKTISALLSFDDYADNTFNVLKRLEDSINVVEWETDKVSIRFSDEFANLIKAGENDRTKLLNAMTNNDLLILYEQSRFEYNNTITASIKEIAENEKGFEIPVKKVTKRSYQSITHTYITTATFYAVTINGRHYEVELNDELKDEKGSFILDEFKDPYYTLVESSFGLESVSKVGDKYVLKGKDVDKEKVIELKIGSISLGNFTFSDDSYKDILVYIESGTKEIRDPDSGLVSYVSYDDQIDPVIKQDSFPNKLISDLQVIFKDININNLIANGTWLEQLSEYVSGNSNTNTSNIQTGLIHPLGLIMSEMFLGNVSASEKVLSMGEIEFSTKFDNDTIKAMILSLLGENRYFQTKEQLNYFVEIFNAFMAPVLDEIAYFENFELLSGNAESVQLYTYRAYLASVLLTTNSAEWFYNTALSYFGATKFKEDAIGSDGYLSRFNDLSSTYQTYVRNLYNTAKKQLEDQFVLETDKAYPEYMRALKNYIDGTLDVDDYFEGRLDLILKSVLSDSAKGKKVDIEKKKIQEAYNSLISLKNEFLNKIDSSDVKNLFNSMFNSFFNDPSSSFSLESNNFTLGTGEKVKDAFDDLTTVDELKTKQELIATLSTAKIDEKDNEESFSYFIFNFISNLNISGYVDEFKQASEKYYSAVNSYLNRKIEYYDTDNSSSNVGKHDDIQVEIEKSFKEAKELYDKAKSIINQIAEINSDKLVTGSEEIKREKFVGESWSALKTNYEKMTAKVAEINLKETLSNDEQAFVTYVECLGSFIRNQEKLDRLNRYEILYACDSQAQSSATQTLDIVVNSRHYQVGQNFTKGKFIEYVLGYDTCVNLGYSPVFVSEGYEGIISFKSVEDDEIIKKDCLDNIQFASESEATTEQKTNWQLYKDKKWGLPDGYYSQNPEIYVSSKYWTMTENGSVVYKKIDNCFGDVYDFAVQIGEISAQLYQMSNLSNLSAGAIDEITIQRDPETEEGEKDLAYQFLYFILENEYLPEDLVSAFFDVKATKDASGTIIESVKTNALGKLGECQDDEEKYSLFNTVLGYLLVTETDKEKKDFVDYTKMTLKQIRIRCLEALIDFEQQGGETVEQNQKRYLTLLAIGCSDWQRTGRGTSGNSIVLGGAINNNWTKENRKIISGLKVNNQSQGVILRLAGLENRPYEELVGAEYSIDFNLLGEDEKNGDIFVICIFDKETKKYFPFLMTNKSNPNYKDLIVDEEGDTFFEHFNLNKSYTNYYMADEENKSTIAFPIMARGIVDSEGMPTLIRKVDGNIEYYRENIMIRDASDVGLEQYYVSVDQVSVNYTGLSSIVNGISKLFTGKTLVEHLSSSVPRFAAHTDYNFCYGVTSQVTARSNGDLVAMSYNFGRGNNLEMSCFFDIERIDILVLMIGTFTIVVALIKALFACIGRVFDITIDFVLGPLVISTINLKSDSKDEKKGMVESESAYDNWKSKLISHILSVFSLAVGFNIFFILAPLVMNAELFNETTIKAFEPLPLFKLATPGFVNQIARLLLLIGLASMTRKAPALFAKILSIDNSFDKGKETMDSVKKMKNQALATWTGQNVAQDIKFAKDNAKNMIPGRALVKQAKSDMKKTSAWVAGRAVRVSARMHGVSKEDAKVLEASVRKVMSDDPTSEEAVQRSNRIHAEKKQEKAQAKKEAKKNKKNKSKK